VQYGVLPYRFSQGAALEILLVTTRGTRRWIVPKGMGFDHYCEWLDERGYHGIDWMPHDAKVREAGAPGARTRIETLITLGRRPELSRAVADGRH
jgi:hypothetical protein